MQTCEHMSSKVAVLTNKRALCLRKYESNEPKKTKQEVEFTIGKK